MLFSLDADFCNVVCFEHTCISQLSKAVSCIIVSEALHDSALCVLPDCIVRLGVRFGHTPLQVRRWFGQVNIGLDSL